VMIDVERVAAVHDEPAVAKWKAKALRHGAGA
jgi:hypothetical protein